MNVSGIMSTLVRWDHVGFQFINGKLYVRFLGDLVFFLAHDALILAVLVAAALGYGCWVGWRRGIHMFFWCAAVVVISNLLHNQILKPFFNRPRPFLALPDVHLCVELRDLSNVSLSFPSTHTASAAALAMVVSGLDPRLRVWAWLFALLIGCGTIYTGGHYPADVLAGYGVGLVLGWVILKVDRAFWPQIEK